MNDVSETAERFIVVGLFAGNPRFRFSVVVDPEDQFKKWRSRHGTFVPVAIHRTEASPEFIRTQFAGLANASIREGAELLQHLPLDIRLLGLMFRAIRLGRDEGNSLIFEWLHVLSSLPTRTQLNS